jgi:hypothetical protein
MWSVMSLKDVDLPETGDQVRASLLQSNIGITHTSPYCFQATMAFRKARIIYRNYEGLPLGKDFDYI